MSNSNPSSPKTPTQNAPPPKGQTTGASSKTAPPPGGKGNSAWILAFLAFIVAAAVVTALVTREPGAPSPVASASEEMDDAELASDAELSESEGDESGETGEAAETEGEDVAAPASRKPATGTLVVSSDVEGANVFLNGKRVGTTPHRAGGLTPGRYEVKVEKDGFQAYQQSIQVTPKRHEIQANLVAAASRLDVATNVSATVYIDGEERGTTPLSLDDLPAGRFELRVSADGYRTHTEMLELTGGTREVSIDLVSPLADLNEAVAVKHKHRLGSCEGVLRATAAGMAYESDHKDAFAVELAQVAEFSADGNDLSLKVDGGRNYNFEERNDNPDAIARFFERVREAVQVSRASP